MPAPLKIKGMGNAILCKCGCGGTRREYDDSGRLREFLPGHYLKMLSRLYVKAGGKMA